MRLVVGETGHILESASFPAFCFLGTVPAIPFIAEIILAASSPKRKKKLNFLKLFFLFAL